jgi:succinate-semialdehyde dehydrogenase / glutarate-semialdehyde dehydrogenase
MILDEVPKQLLIGGEWRDAADGATLEVEDPATEDTLAEIAAATPDDARAALDAAANAQEGWAATPPNERSEILYRAFEAIRQRKDELALLMTLEMGKPLHESAGEVAYAAEFFRWFSGEALRLDGSYKQSGDAQSRVLVMKQPVGPSLLITPWNFPLAMGTRKIGPAIAAGCTMIWKPAKQTPLSALALARLLIECGLPPNVLNVITAKSARAATEPLLADPRLRKVSFTGSTEVGRELIAAAAPNVLKVSMELGGNAPSSCSTTPTSTPPSRAR